MNEGDGRADAPHERDADAWHAQLLELLRARSFARKRVILASGRESNFFIDCKQTILGAEAHNLAGNLMLNAAEQGPGGSFDAIAGVELGGCPLASAASLLSAQRGRPKDAVYVRKDAKDHGSKRMLEGDSQLEPGATIVILEDVTTTGGSTLKAVAKLREAGYVVKRVVTLVDRLEGGREAIEAAGLELRAIYTRRDFIPD